MSTIETQANFTGNDTDNDFNLIATTTAGDFSPFYIAITICTILLAFLLILNIVCCCSRYSEYWLDRHTGNRWIVSIWSATPHRQPPLDFTEIENQYQPMQIGPYESKDYHKILKQESVEPSISQQPLAYLDLHERESDI